MRKKRLPAAKQERDNVKKASTAFDRSRRNNEHFPLAI